MKEFGIIASIEKNHFPFGKQRFYFDDMFLESENLGIRIFVFSPLDWVFNEKKIKVYFKENNLWKSSIRKIPKIIYDRFTVKEKLDIEKIENFRAFLIKKNFYFTMKYEMINLLKNKLDFHNFLSKNNVPTLKGVLIKNINENVLENYFNYNKTIYIKPLNGSRGRNISIIKKENNKYNLFFNSKKNLIKRKEILFYLKKKFDKNLFFIQKKAKTFEFSNSPFDIRVLIQNKGNNNYALTGMAVRKGKKNHWISNLDAGGKALRLEEINFLVKKEMNKNIYFIKKEIENICLKTCELLHSKYGDFSEIAFDILLTKDLGIIILEGNSKPARWIFNSIAFDLKDEFLKKKYFNLRKKSVRLPLIFAMNNKFF